MIDLKSIRDDNFSKFSLQASLSLQAYRFPVQSIICLPNGTVVGTCVFLFSLKKQLLALKNLYNQLFSINFSSFNHWLVVKHGPRHLVMNKPFAEHLVAIQTCRRTN